MPGRPSVSAACSGSVGEPTVVTGTSVEPYTRVTTARSKYAAARRISDGDTEAPPQMNTLRSGNRVPARSAAASSPSRNGVAPAMWVQRCDDHDRHRLVRVPAVHQHGGGAQEKRAFERVDGSADVGDRRRHQEPVAGVDQPVIAKLADQRVDRVMAVQNTFRATRGARGVEDHPHGGRVQCRHLLARPTPARAARRTRCGRRARRVRRRSRAASPSCAVTRSSHREIVVLPELARHEDHSAVDVVEDEGQFAVAE